MTATLSSVVGTSAYRGGALREDLANFISNISREERPLQSAIGQTNATLPRHEWQSDTLRTPAANSKSEAFEFNTDDNTDITTRRIDNYTQVFGETVHISGSLLESDPAGAANWFAYSMQKRGREMMRDVEFQMIRYEQDGSGTDAANVVYKTTNNRQLGSIYAYAYNWVRLPTDANDGAVASRNASGTGNALTTTAGVAFNLTTAADANRPEGAVTIQFVVNPTGTDLVDPTLDHIESLLEEMYTNGGRPNAAMIPPRLKGTVSKLLIDGNGGAAQRRADDMSKKVNIAVDSVLTEFGFDIALIPNYVMANSDANNTLLFLDTDMVKKSVLKGMTVQDDGTARYGKGAIMFEECTLEVRNGNSVGVIIGIA